MIKLYYAPKTRATRPRWMLEEIGAAYELVRLQLGKGEHKRPDYLAIHPHGAVPAFRDDTVTLFESAAICAYLADKFPDKRLAPPLGSPERGLYYQWLVYSMATMEPPVLKVFLNTMMLPEEKRSAAIAEEGRTQWQDVARVLEQALEGKTFLLGDSFSAADVMVGSILGWSRVMGLIDGYPGLQAYVGRLTSRPAFQRANAD
jgi:glutathione S-transferase